MPKLLSRLMQVCICVAATLPVGTTSATAEGNGSLFSANANIYGANSDPMGLPRPKPLLYTGATPAVIKDGPEQVYLTRTTSGARYSQQDLNCMAEALYHEARGEGAKGQAAVAEVILNRVDSRRFPSSVCAVVNQPSQFSYTIGGAKPIRNKAVYLRVRKVAEAALSGAPRVLTGGATYFHTPAVRPKWSYRFQRTATIGRHIFYSTGQRVASN